MEQQMIQAPKVARHTAASYASYAEAQRAVDYLSDQKLPVERLAIVAEGLRFVEQVTGRLNYGRAALNGALSGATTGTFVGFPLGLFNLIAPVASALNLALYGLIFGAIAGAIIAALTYAFTAGRRDFTSVSGMQAERYNVMVDDEVAAQAEQLLVTFVARQSRPSLSMTRARWSYAGLLLLGGLLAGCGGEDNQVTELDRVTSGGTAHTRMVSADPLEKMEFAPAILTANAAEPLRIQFTNPVAIPHSFVLTEPGDVEPVLNAGLANGGRVPPGTAGVIAASDVLNSDAIVMLDVPADLVPGTYPYICTVPGHYDLGMKGELIISQE